MKFEAVLFNRVLALTRWKAVGVVSACVAGK